MFRVGEMRRNQKIKQGRDKRTLRESKFLSLANKPFQGEINDQ